jgi:F-box-like
MSCTYRFGLMLELMSSNVQASLSSGAIARIDSELTLFRSSIQSSSTRSAAISSVDEEIRASRLHVLSLLTRRNALMPIFLLPPELLARIFHFFALVEPSWSSPGELGWIRATHVCRYWRQVALEDSSLWATISGVPRSKRWIGEVLARAKCALLAIDICGPNREILSLFSSRFSHIRELCLHNLSRDDRDNIQELCKLEAPVLEHFELAVLVNPYPVPVPVVFSQFNRTKFFKGNYPKLREFSLRNVYVRWFGIPRAQLSQLRIILPEEISGIDGISLHDIFDQFIDVLTNNPGLEDLVLQYCLPSMPSHFSHGQTIHLPRLAHLGLAGSSSRVANMLKMLKLPSSTKLLLRCAKDTATSNDCAIIPLVSAHFNNSKLVTFKSFRLTLDPKEQSICLLASSSLPNSTHPHTFGGCLESDAELYLHLSMEANNLERMCDILPIAEVEFLSILAPDMVQPVKWGELFRRCEKITTIEADGCGTTTLLETLTPSKPVRTTSGGKGKWRRGDRDAQAQGADDIAAHVPPVFPKLTTLVLRDLDFSENVPRRGNLYDVLMNTLRRRKSHNVTLKSLTIEYSVITDNRANALKQLVPEFHCSKETRRRLSSHAFVDEFSYSSDFDDDYDDDGGDHWADFVPGSSQAEFEWWENYSDGW